jgi:hypothetical protein
VGATVLRLCVSVCVKLVHDFGVCAHLEPDSDNKNSMHCAIRTMQLAPFIEFMSDKKLELLSTLAVQPHSSV